MTDDMQAVWQRYDARLERVENLLGIAATASLLDRAERSMRRARTGLILEIVCGALLTIVIGSVSYDAAAAGERSQFAASLIAWLYALGLVGGAIAQLAFSHEVRFDDPVAIAQRGCERALRIRVLTTLWALVLGPFVWLPMAAVAIHAIFGVDLLRDASAIWIAGNFAFGVAFAASAVAVLAALARRGKLSPLVQRLLDDATGRGLRESNAFLRELGEE
ncbi:MAG: hypothetical protein JO029_15845 [Candidatus Eremiobacteraeota bacterium]|nr:hypothetical protein [Candidatus Eremiobacteraeota bacterium]MBV8656148.1 hypothetical protein [Candidatus Eremiobacteraeota bacterium]